MILIMIMIMIIIIMMMMMIIIIIIIIIIMAWSCMSQGVNSNLTYSSFAWILVSYQGYLFLFVGPFY